MNRFLLLCFSLFVLISCDPSKRAASSSGDDGMIRFGILHINDVYEIAPLENGKVGGMARVAHLYKELKKDGQPILFVHAGDFLNPSLLGNLKYEGSRIKGAQMIEVMNAAGVDVVAFGNHEFDLKENELQQRLNESKFDWIGTSVRHNTDGGIKRFQKEMNGYGVDCEDVYYWPIQDRDGTKIKVGLFSTTVTSNPQDYVHYLDPFDAAITAANNLHKDCEVVLGLTHLNLVQDLKLAGMVEDVPILMGGHDHDNMKEQVNETLVCKADANAKTAYFYQFTYDVKKDKWTIKPELIPITDAMPEDSAVAEIVSRWKAVQDVVISQVIADPYQIVYRADVPLDGRESSIRNKQTNLGEMINKSMIAAAKKKCDAAFFNGGSVRIDDQVSGDVMAVDIFRILPFGGSMVEVDIKGSLLTQILDAGLENQGSGGYLQLYQLEKIKGWSIGDKIIEPEKVYHVAFTDFLLTGFENRLDFMTPDNPGYIKIDKPDENTDDLRNDIRKVIIEYMLSM